MHNDVYEGGHSPNRSSGEVFSKPVKAGKRTYFFDVKSTKDDKDFYLTITESKRRTEQDGNFTYDKHKIFLYKEDFTKFVEGLEEAIQYIQTNCLNADVAGDTAAKDEIHTKDTDIF